MNNIRNNGIYNILKCMLYNIFYCYDVICHTFEIKCLVIRTKTTRRFGSNDKAFYLTVFLLLMLII